MSVIVCDTMFRASSWPRWSKVSFILNSVLMCLHWSSQHASALLLLRRAKTSLLLNSVLFCQDWSSHHLSRQASSCGDNPRQVSCWTQFSCVSILWVASTFHTSSCLVETIQDISCVYIDRVTNFWASSCLGTSGVISNRSKAMPLMPLSAGWV